MNIDEANARRIRQFVDAHPQHEVRLSLGSMEAVKIHFVFHNGDDWMGLWERTIWGELNAKLRQMFQTAKRWRPKLLAKVET